MYFIFQNINGNVCGIISEYIKVMHFEYTSSMSYLNKLSVLQKKKNNNGEKILFNLRYTYLHVENEIIIVNQHTISFKDEKLNFNFK